MTLACLAIVALAVIEFAVGESLAGTFGQAAGRAGGGSPPPTFTLSDVMTAAAR